MIASLAARLRPLAPLALDAAGLGLLTTAAGMWHTIAGVAAGGLSCFLLRYMIDTRKAGSDQR